MIFGAELSSPVSKIRRDPHITFQIAHLTLYAVLPY